MSRTSNLQKACRWFHYSALIVLPFSGLAATNDLTSALQRGLFEEEANRNLDAAAQAYRDVSAQFDKNRELAATAIFRLGEVYRKQGKTNEAVAQYDRIVREFPDQNTLAMLSRQNLAGLKPLSASGVGGIPAPGTSFQERLNELIARASTGTDTNSEFGQRMQRIIQRASPESEAVAAFTSEEAEIRRIQAMIKDSPDLINAKNAASGATPLHSAAANGQLTVAKFLLENGAAVDAKDRAWGGQTPLHYAAGAGHKAMVELLLDHKADVQAADDNGTTPMHLAAEKGFKAVVETLLARGADVNSKRKSGHTPLHLAVVNGHRSLAATLLKAKADPNIVPTDLVTAVGGSSYYGPALHIAISRGDREMWELLLANGADVNLRSKLGYTPLREAVANDQETAVEALFSRGAGVDIADNDGTTPLLVAMDRQQAAMVKTLLDHRANTEVVGTVHRRTGQQGSTASVTSYPLRFAVEDGNLEIVTLLLEHGANANGADTNSSPIWWALTAAKTNILALLLKFKANPNVVSLDGNTPLLRAVQTGEKETVVLLLESGADAKFTTKSGWTALHTAAMTASSGHDRREITELLLAKGADPNARDEQGRTPLDLTKGSPSGPGQLLPPPAIPAPSPGGVGIGVNRTLPTRTLRQPVSATSESQPADIATVLRQHGALDDLPDFKVIRITRRTLRPAHVFSKDSASLNRFTLFEVLLNFYLRSSYTVGDFATPPNLIFPDLSRVRVLRSVAGKLTERKEITINLLNATNGIDCAKDLPLEFGDVIEIPEREHTLAEPGVGLTNQQKEDLAGCLRKKVRFTVRGGGAEVNVGAFWAYLSSQLSGGEVQRILRSSSDLSRLKVLRTDPKTGKKQEILVDAQKFQRQWSPDDLWLRDGDVIEVPDKL